jgi:hypothetical protein
MQHDNSTEFLEAESEWAEQMEVISSLMIICRDLAEDLEEVHDAALEGKLSEVELQFWKAVRADLVERGMKTSF